MAHKFENGKLFVDTAFLNALGRAHRTAELMHVGFGDFVLKENGKPDVDFTRVDGTVYVPPAEFSGRPHEVYCRDPERLKSLVEQMVSGQHSTEVPS